MRRQQRVAGDARRGPQARQRLLRPGEHPSKVIYPVVRELADDGIPVAMACRVLKLSTSGLDDGSRRGPSHRDLEQAPLRDLI